MKNNVEKINCIVKKVHKYFNNNFAVLYCENKADNKKFQAVGTLSNVKCGAELVAEGFWKHHEKYGLQFVVKKYEEKLPDTISGIEQYLGGGAIKGIGPVLAKKILQKFGDKTLEIIKEDPDKLLEIPGIGDKIIERIRAVNKYDENLILLFDCGIGKSLAVKIYDAYGDDCKAEIYKNPYNLIQNIEGIGFTKADIIAEKINFGQERYERLSAGLLHTLGQIQAQGHCYATRYQLLQKSCILLGVSLFLLEIALDKMIDKYDVICVKLSENSQEDAIYLPKMYHAEVDIEKQLNRIKNSERRIKFRPEFLYDSIFAFDPDQISAIRTAMYEKIMIITGGPGTGKTTTAKGIISIYKSEKAKVLLAAPTGRSAKCLSAGTGMEAQTIHRLLKLKFLGNKQYSECQLDGDVLIVDECSMIDVEVMHILLKAIPDKMSLILLGNADQLPSVGPGNVLQDLIESNKFPVIKLTNIHRQDQTISRIVENAHLINNGLMPIITNGKDTDFFFIEENNTDKVAETIVDLVKNRLPRHYNITASSIQVLAPMKETVVGTNNLNKMLQNALNKDGYAVEQGNFTFKTRDKVMQLKNNYDKEVFNGDIGIVHFINENQQELTVDFDNRMVIYKFHELNELVLAYATTIHKSQGSEYPIVVMPWDLSNDIMLQRNLLYTAVTRAKKIMVVVGSKEAIKLGVQKCNVTKRNTLLGKNRLSIQ